MNKGIAGFGLLLLSSLPLASQGIIDPIVVGNELRAGISLPGGIAADLSISFEQVEGLSPANLGITAELVSLLDALPLPWRAGRSRVGRPRRPRSGAR